MSVFAIYHPYTGEIMQSNKVYDANEKYDNQIREFGKPFIKREQNRLISMEHSYIQTSTQELRDRKPMLISVSKERIEAGGNDSVVFKGIPKNARLQVFNNIPGVGEVNPYDLVMEDGDREFEYGVPMPCLFTVSFIRWPFRDWSMKFEAVAP